jgi:hypothetical protein
VKVKLTGAEGAVLSEQVEIQIAERNLPPKAEMTIRQGSKGARLVAVDGGDIVFALDAEDPEAESLTIDWSRSSADLLFTATQSDTQLVLDPTTLTPGNYFVSVNVSDSEYIITLRSGCRGAHVVRCQ